MAPYSKDFVNDGQSSQVPSIFIFYVARHLSAEHPFPTIYLVYSGQAAHTPFSFIYYPTPHKLFTQDLPSDEATSWFPQVPQVPSVANY